MILSLVKNIFTDYSLSFFARFGNSWLRFFTYDHEWIFLLTVNNASFTDAKLSIEIV